MQILVFTLNVLTKFNDNEHGRAIIYFGDNIYPKLLIEYS